MRTPPGWTFWQNSQYGTQDPVDMPNCPAELNYYRKFLIRMAFADMKVLVLLGLGLILGILNWVFLQFFGMWFI